MVEHTQMVVGLGSDLLCALLTPDGEATAADLEASVQLDAALAALTRLRLPSNDLHSRLSAHVAADATAAPALPLYAPLHPATLRLPVALSPGWMLKRGRAHAGCTTACTTHARG